MIGFLPPSPILPPLPEGGVYVPCPHCFLRYDALLASPGTESGRRLMHPTKAFNCMSRRDSQYICHDCGRSEALADMLMPNPSRDEDAQFSTDNMMRTVIYQDRMEGRRLPPGMPWGPSQTLTTGSCLGEEFHDPCDDRCPDCDSLWAFGFMCTECHAPRPAYEMLKNHPAVIERERREREQAEQERIAKALEAERVRLETEVAGYMGPAWAIKSKLCANCGETEGMKDDDYICVRCRVQDDLVGNPLMAHVLQRLDRWRKG